MKSLHRILLGVALCSSLSAWTLADAHAQTDWYGYGIMRQQTINGINLEYRRAAQKAKRRAKASKERRMAHSRKRASKVRRASR